MSAVTARIYHNNDTGHFVFAAKYKNGSDLFIYQHIPDFDTVTRDISDRFQLPRILLGFSFNSALLVPINNQASLGVLFARKQEERVIFVRKDEAPQEVIEIKNKHGHRFPNNSERLPLLEQTQLQTDGRFIDARPQHPKRSRPTTSTPVSLVRTNSIRDTRDNNSSRSFRHGEHPTSRPFNSEECNDNNSTPSNSGSASIANISPSTGPLFRCKDFERVVPISIYDSLLGAKHEINQILIRPHMHPKFDTSIISRDYKRLQACQAAQKTRQLIPIYVILGKDQSKVYMFAGNYRVTGIHDLGEPLQDFFGSEGWVKVSPTYRHRMLEMHSVAPYRQIDIELVDRHLPEIMQAIRQI